VLDGTIVGEGVGVIVGVKVAVARLDLAVTCACEIRFGEHEFRRIAPVPIPASFKKSLLVSILKFRPDVDRASIRKYSRII
jgi:hypothetical protein